MKFFHICLSLFFFLSIFTVARSADPDCVYTVYVKTGSIHRAGTFSNITLTLYDAAGPTGKGIRILNLVAWGGLMGPDYTYFMRGQLDIFSGRGPCLNGPVCAMNLTSDGTGRQHEWYVDYVEVTTTGVHLQCAQKTFIVDQWLAKERPYQLYAIRNDCLSADKNSIINDQDLSMTSGM